MFMNMKKICILFCLVLSFFASYFCLGSITASSAYAESITFTAENYAYYDMNSSLFSTFCSLASAIQEEPVSSFSSSFFSPNKREYESVCGTGEQATLIVNDLNSGILDLTTGENARYDCLKNRPALSSISGMAYMDFAGVIRLVLDDNNLTTVESGAFAGIPTLTQIEINNNNLTSFSISRFFDGKITLLSLSHNALDRVSLICAKQNAVVNLSFNSIKEIEHITTEGTSLDSLDLSFNMLSTFDSESALQKFGCEPFVFVQGLKNSYSFCDKICVNNDENYNFKIHIKYALNSKMRTEQGRIGDIVVSSGSGFDWVYVPAGKINVYFTYDSLPSGVDESLFEDKSYNVKLSMPSYEIYEKGTKTTKVDLSDEFSVKFSIDVQSSPNAQDINKFAQIHSFVNSSTENKGSEIKITNDGDYVFVTYSVFDDIESEHLTLAVKKHNASAIFWALMLLFFAIIIVVAYFVLRKWFRDGGNVAPISSKDTKSPFSRRDMTGGDDYIDLSDKN